MTGKGHGSDRALMLGLEGETPEDVSLERIPAIIERIHTEHRLQLGGTHEVKFDDATDLRFHRTQRLPLHSNGIRFFARTSDGGTLLGRTYYSIGGGFVLSEAEANDPNLRRVPDSLPFPYQCGDDLLRMARESGLSVSEMTLRNESAWRPEAETRAALLRVWRAMHEMRRTRLPG